MLVIKQFPVHKCGHEKNPISASGCLLSLMKRSKDEHYMLATQDPSLTEKVRAFGYVPLIYLKMNTIIMEKPQSLALDMAEESQSEALKIDSHQFKTLKKLKTIEFGEQAPPVKRKRKGPKEPNPLSCKKKKKSTSFTVTKAESSEKKKRKRNKRIPNHIKRMFSKIETELCQTIE